MPLPEQEAVPPEVGSRARDHLIPQVRAMLDLRVEERIKYVRQDKWLQYAEAGSVIAAMSDLLERPRQVRMRGVLLAARANNGKSALLKRFRVLNQPTVLEDGQAALPVVPVWTPDEPNEAKLWSQVLKGLKEPHSSSDSARRLREQAMRSIEYHQVRMLMFDEMHNLLLGSEKKTEHLLTVLKMLVNELSVRIVVAGTGDVVKALGRDKQLATRFDCFALPPWDEGNRLSNLLNGLEAVLPLPEPSDLKADGMVRLMKAHAGRTIGGYVVQVQGAAALAIEAGKPRIDEALIRKVQKTSGIDLSAVIPAL